ncbi:MAG: LPS translocon maturation chaperone LptM [Inhella sp.]
MSANKMTASVGAPLRRTAMTLIAVLLLAGCGQKGPLKLPPPASSLALVPQSGD